ncbi:MAG: hypothetical protein Crog4KO_12030 [Crocinitomicaceae bacterium]
MKLSHLLLFSSLSFFLFTSCSDAPTNKEKERKDVYITEEDLVLEYKYTEDLMVYLSDNFEEEIVFNEVDSLLFIPLNSCMSCVEYTLYATALNPYNGKVIIGGAVEDFSQLETPVREIEEQVTNVLVDTNFAMNEYLIQVGGPVLLLKNKEDWRIIELSIANWPIIINILGWKEPEYEQH